MRRSSAVVLSLLAATLACLALALACAPNTPPAVVAAPQPATPATPAASSPPADPGSGSSGPSIQMSPTIPADATFGSGSSIGDIQEDFDIFSWNSFISLNWPPGPGGEGDPNKKPGEGPDGDNPTVWEGYQDSSAIFLPGGKTPEWGKGPAVPEVCRALYQPGKKLLWQVGKTPDVLEETTQPFDTGPLVDQNGVYARFQILVNRNMFDYILGNSLYSKAGQQAFGGTVKFPCGGGQQLGAIMVKSSWKVLGKGDDPSRFHVSKALVYTPASTDPPIEESCSEQTVGLVGLHIAHKANSAPQWVWSTFEQVDNVPTEAAVKQGSLAAHYNFFDPACKDCQVNEPPPRPWIPNQPGQPVQVVRMDVLPDFATASAKKHNAVAQGLYKQINPASVWQYYELVSTQWPTDPGPGNCDASATDPFGNPAPQFLANTTLETYVQGSTPNVSSSCIECHGNAAMTTGKASDFTYLLERAQ